MIVYPAFVGFIKLCYKGHEDPPMREQGMILNLQKHFFPEHSQVRNSKKEKKNTISLSIRISPL